MAFLNCAVVVDTSNEKLTDRNIVSERIFMLARPDLEEDLYKLKDCQTGEEILTKLFNLPARFIIHTVGPKYKSTAQLLSVPCTAAIETYFSWQKKQSIGSYVINSAKQGDPLERMPHT